MNIFLNDLPQTPEGAKLNLAEEIKNNCKVIYKLNADRSAATLTELWNPDVNYSDDYIIASLQSSYGGISDKYDIGTNFANIEGSSYDTFTYKTSWIELLDTCLNPDKNKGLKNYDCDTCCAELDTIYAGGTDDRAFKSLKGKDFKCTSAGVNIIKGGHVIINANNSSAVAEGSKVLLLPICAAHNSFCYIGKRGEMGRGYHMKLARDMKGVLLNNYLKLDNRARAELQKKSHEKI